MVSTQLSHYINKLLFVSIWNKELQEQFKQENDMSRFAFSVDPMGQCEEWVRGVVEGRLEAGTPVRRLLP